ncbi:MAG TPA: hypothetical protein VHD58_05065 [Mycobacteriales bacterium]|nr:hypothetical protein [Mycobacteriales bacterium]
MSRFDDDMSPFRDEPVFRALTGPATPDELAGEAEARAAFRAAGSAGPRRRLAVKMGASGAAAAAVVALTGGAAAAYTAVLPSPVQQTLHEAFGPLGVPAPQPHRHAKPVATPSPTPSQAAAPTPAPVSPAATARTDTSPPSTPARSASAEPTIAVSPTTTTTLPVIALTPSATPTPTTSPSGRPPLPGATLLITTSDTEVDVGDAVTISGTLTDETGTPVASRQIVLAEHLVGEPGWNRIDEVATNDAGEVSFTVPDLEHNAHFALRAGGHVHSNVVSVGVDPTITTAVATPAADASDTTVTVTVVGAEAGDAVTLDRGGRHPTARTAELTTTGQATFTVPVPRDHPVTYRVLVHRTHAHLAKAALVEVPSRAQPAP